MTSETDGAVEHFDVLIVGAGLSGIAAGYYLQTRLPGKRYAILEGRGAIGGTWDLFRYPGIRSDSDMFTLGYSFKPWKNPKSIADGPSILAYVRETAQEYGIDRHIRFHQRVQAASWSSKEARWTVDVTVGPDATPFRYTCNFLYACAGYYRYEEGYTPVFPGRDDFEGIIVHPQHWPEDLDYRGKRVVVIGSGATAMTLVPAMAPTAEHVTMVQRSPTYVLSLPSEDRIANKLREVLPEKTANTVARWKNVTFATAFFQLCRRAPEAARKLLRKGVEAGLPNFDIDTHFNPHYSPWDQRLCVIPDSDLYRTIRTGKVSVITNQIRTFTKKGILLESGEELQADIIVTATGLQLLSCGGIRFDVDGRDVEISKTFVYKGLMLSDVPNFALCAGYTNASWTLRAELSTRYVCRLLEHMDRKGYRQCVAHLHEGSVETRPLLDLTAGYVQRAIEKFPKQGTKAPWYFPQNYFIDSVMMRFGSVDDGVMTFSGS
ncbi:MAG: NAD(P)/FAD-dependent oxidoreductase [Polyangiaceae bacterium]|nr:NAD(P)/FAD-dependent oxidoreductase [Polyangiaceae bacterium]